MAIGIPFQLLKYGHYESPEIVFENPNDTLTFKIIIIDNKNILYADSMSIKSKAFRSG